MRSVAIFLHFRRLDPIDRSSHLVGPIDSDGVAALAQASDRGPRRVRQPAGGGDKLGESRAPSRCSSSMTCAILVPPRGDVGVEATLLFGLSMPAGSETGSAPPR